LRIKLNIIEQIIEILLLIPTDFNNSKTADAWRIYESLDDPQGHDETWRTDFHA